jgi:hypothetical protein
MHLAMTFALGTIMALGTLGCGSNAGGDEATAATGAYLSGTYMPVGTGGTLASLHFESGNHYVIAGRCADVPSCSEEGSFAYDPATATLSLENVLTGKTRLVPLKVLSTLDPPAAAQGSLLRPQSLPSSGTQTTSGGTGLVIGSGDLILGTVGSADVDGELVQRTDVAWNNCTDLIPTGFGDSSGAYAAAWRQNCPDGTASTWRGPTTKSMRG